MFPRLRCGGNISFLVDTGADRTIIMPDDGSRFNIDYSQLQGDVPSTGIGGISNNFEEHGIIVFSEPQKRIYVYSLTILLASAGPEHRRLPSLLGRDILSQWRMVMDESKSKLIFTVRSADVSIKV